MPRAGPPDRAALALPMRGWTLGSGSSGNALLLESGSHRILVDCGFGPRAIATRLKAIDVAPESISALVLTHEHVDHAQGAERAQKKYRWPVYASMGTLAALRDIEPRWRRAIAPGETLALDGFSLEAIAIPHDAAGPLAFAVTATASGARVGVAHDLGAVPDALRLAFADCDALCLEANHDVELLRTGPYPRALQERIRGGRGHINNSQAAALATDLAGPGLQSVTLLHLSEVNNRPELAERAVAMEMRRAGFRGVVRAAARRGVAEAFVLGARRRVSVQLSLDV
jgi:phosphoribosyl 1,2-cyclic phosphodiesterase